jgi:hypothetical protein
MKLFKVAQGTKGYLLVSDGVMPTLRAWTVRKDMIFQREDLEADPVSLSYDLIRMGKNTIGYDLVKKGYALFNPPQDCEKGWHGTGNYRKPKYVLVVLYSEVEVI